MSARHADHAVVLPAPSGAVYSCVIDSDARFHLDALRWFATLTKTAGVPAVNLIIHAVGDSESDVLRYLQRQGVQVQRVEPFDRRSPTCNKVSGAVALASVAAADRLYVLTDSDVAIARNPSAALRGGSTLAAKIVDAPNPPLEVLRRVFEEAGLELPTIVEPDCDRSGQTVACNFNGGLYIVPGTLLPRLAEAWARWARWLLDRATLGRHGFFVDQVAMAMAITQERIGTTNLGREWNFPTHVPAWVFADAKPPAVVHYHGRVESTGLISPTGRPAVDGVVATLNEAISSIWHDAFPNESFWNWRYKTNPRLGSGVGSRGAPLEEKRRLLRDAVARVQPASVLDVGCGDGEATCDIRLRTYTGLDVSGEAVRLARAKRPDGSFHVGVITEWSETAELTICLDVLIHLSDADDYQRTIEALLKATTRALLISGYEEAPSSDSPMIHFHEPLSVSIKRVEPRARLFKLREAHAITTFAIVKPPFDRNWPRLRHIRRFLSTAVSVPGWMKTLRLRRALAGRRGQER